MSRPLVTTMIPVFNGERFLAEAIESSLSQDHNPHEVIVVDDGSTDRSAEIAEGYPEVLLIRQENAGQAAARNAAIQAASGEFIANLDADDRSAPGRISAQLGYLLEHPRAAVVLGRQAIRREPGVELPGWLLDPRSALDGVEEAVPGPGEALNPYYQPCTLMVRRTTLDRVGPYDPAFTMSEDVDLMFRIWEAGLEVATIDAQVLERRMHGGNLTYDDDRRRIGVMHAFKARMDRRRALGSAPPEQAPRDLDEQLP